MTLGAFDIVNGFEFCKQFTNCVDCTDTEFRCAWKKDVGKCGVRTSIHAENDLIFDDTCPIDYTDSEETFLPDWMGKVLSVIGDSALLDLSIPGTHDTLTYDLSTTVAEGGIDEMYKLAEFLHNHTDQVPGNTLWIPNR